MLFCLLASYDNIDVTETCLVMNLNCPLNSVSCSLGVPVDMIEAKPGHPHVREVNACIKKKGGGGV